ncbi:MAG TPA: sigma-54-dependent transcriptional regulator [Candidatus Brocadiia bacterium]|nr:sigma-54-dependent Fis family transcriptional regulator [Planctomycetota bacterium]MDO8093944.1 sigma-54 dependent transcriptional regulator [Candidatus Brocadiales bacterium]
MKRVSILVIDDEENHAEATAETLRRVGYKCNIATRGKDGLKAIENSDVDIVVTDLIMHDLSGMEILKAAKKKCPETEVIVITGYGTVENAVSAMQNGATTFLLKPVNIEQLRTVVDSAVQKQSLFRNNIELKKQIDEKFGFSGIIGNSQKMHRIFNILKQISPTTATVLIMGESGTGKELIARAIHHNSPRKDNPFVVLNSAAISESLLESELFGHEKGAFTGAIYQRKGKFEHADGGTLFLDEVGDMPLSTQVKLLRVIEDGKIVRVGSNDPTSADVRIIAATNQDLPKLVKENKFREDLYFRLNVVSLKLPPLREKQDDIPLLIDAFIKDLSGIHGKHIIGMTPEARRVLYSYNWPGNVRELKNCIESMVVMSFDDVLDIDDLPDYLSRSHETLPPVSTLRPGMSLAEAEKELIKDTLSSFGGNREESARVLGIGERTLYRKLDKYGLK